MKQVFYTKQFKKDYKRQQRTQGKHFILLKTVMHDLLVGKTLPTKYKNHPLKGNFKGRFELHIKPDWLLIYRIDGEAIYFERTGSHSELFE